MSAIPKILLLDDDVKLCGMLQSYLRIEHIDVDCVHSVAKAQSLLLSPQSSGYDLLVLDIMMPEISGLEVLRTLRAHTLSIPVIMLTGRCDLMDKVDALQYGADDYVCKPCDPRELAARINAVLRRVESAKPAFESDNIRIADLELSRSSRIVRINGCTVELTDTEFQLLYVLLINAGKVVSLESLSYMVLERKYDPNDRSLNTHACHLRHKLGAYPDGTDRIKTIRNKGFEYCIFAK